MRNFIFLIFVTIFNCNNVNAQGIRLALKGVEKVVLKPIPAVVPIVPIVPGVYSVYSRLPTPPSPHQQKIADVPLRPHVHTLTSETSAPHQPVKVIEPNPSPLDYSRFSWEEYQKRIKLLQQD